MKRATLMLSALVLLLGGVGQAEAGMILNGGFESETPGDSNLSDHVQNTPNNWTLTGNAANWWTGGEPSGRGGITAYDGNWFASFSNYPPGSPPNDTPSGYSGLEQTVPTTSGQQYTLGFEYIYIAGGSSAEIKATWDNTVLMDTVFHNSTNGWQQASFTVTGTGSDTVAFSGYALGWNGIDDVTLTPLASSVPEPSTVTLLGIGIACMVGYGWRRRKLVAA